MLKLWRFTILDEDYEILDWVKWFVKNLVGGNYGRGCINLDRWCKINKIWSKMSMKFEILPMNISTGIWTISHVNIIVSLGQKNQMSWNSQTKSRREGKKSLCSRFAIFLCVILKQQKIGDENHLKNSDKVPGGIEMINIATRLNRTQGSDVYREPLWLITRMNGASVLPRFNF